MARKISNTWADSPSQKAFSQADQQKRPIFTKDISNFINHIETEEIIELDDIKRIR